MAPVIKTDWEIVIMREAGKIVAESLELARNLLKPGITTGEIDSAIEKFILSKSSYPVFKGYRGFPASSCISINEEVVHGIPGKRVIIEGDIVSIDVGVKYKNYVGDIAGTFPVGKVHKDAQRLINVTRGALYKAIETIGPYVPLSEVSRVIQNYAESRGYSVIRKFVGHGVGQNMHEDPEVPNFVSESTTGYDIILKPGMVIAPEPMITPGSGDVSILEDKWTAVTKDGKICAHFEHTVAVTKNGREILTEL
jgi:methionyl aminopeptidase